MIEFSLSHDQHGIQWMLERPRSKATSCLVTIHFRVHAVALLLQCTCEKWVVATGRMQKKKQHSGDKTLISDFLNLVTLLVWCFSLYL